MQPRSENCEAMKRAAIADPLGLTREVYADALQEEGIADVAEMVRQGRRCLCVRSADEFVVDLLASCHQCNNERFVPQCSFKGCSNPSQLCYHSHREGHSVQAVYRMCLYHSWYHGHCGQCGIQAVRLDDWRNQQRSTSLLCVPCASRIESTDDAIRADILCAIAQHQAFQCGASIALTAGYNLANPLAVPPFDPKATAVPRKELV